jgi:hypothetical protein
LTQFVEQNVLWKVALAEQKLTRIRRKPRVKRKSEAMCQRNGVDARKGI